MFKVEIKTDNAAFDEDPRGEIERIIKESMRKLTLLNQDEQVLRDINGNTVGTLTYTKD